MIKYLILPLALTLSSCGFTPVHAPANGTAMSAFKNIEINMIEADTVDQSEGTFWLQQALYDRLGTHNGGHVLTLEPSFRRTGVGLTSEDISSRYDMNVRVKYKLEDKISGDVLDSGTITAKSTFGSARDPYSRTASEKDTLQNVTKTAADRIITRMAAYYADAG